MDKGLKNLSAFEIEYDGRFPSDENPTSLKQKEEYGQAYAWAIWQSAQEASFSFSFDSDYEKIMRNRKFSRGQHTVEEYKPRAIPVETEYVTLDFSISTPLPKFIRITKDNILNHAYKVNVTPYDSHVHTKYEEEKNKLLAKMSIAKQLGELAASGVVPEQILLDDRISKAPKDPEEAEAYLATTFQVIEAIALEKIIKSAFKRNNTKRLERKVVTDLVENNFAALKVCTDEYYRSSVEYIDPLYLVTSYCEHDDFSDMQHWGYRKFITVGELRKRMAGKLTEKEIFEIVKANIGKRVNANGNYQFPDFKYFQNLSDSDKRALNSVMIEVLDFEVLTSDKVVYRSKELDTGGFDYRRKSSEYKGTSKGVESDGGYIEKIYCGEWVVGFDCMLSWKTKPNVVRKIRNGKYDSKPCFSIVIRKPDMLEMSNVSMCEEAIPHIEQMIIYQIKLQHFVAVAKPSGFSYNTAALTAALPGMGLGELTPVDMADITTSLGNNYYSSITEDGQQILDQNPVRPNPTTLGDGVRILAELYNAELFKVKDILGLNQAVDASQPDARVNETAQNLAYQAHKASIKGLQDTYLGMIDEAAERVAYINQMAIQADEETEELRELLSDPEMKVLKMKEMGELMFNIAIELEPDMLQKRSIIEKIGFAVQQGTLDIEDAIKLENIVEDGESIEKAQVMFAQMQSKRKKERQQEIQSQMMAEQQSAQAKAQAELAKEKELASIDVEKEQMKKDLELRNEKEKEGEKRITMTLEYEKKEELLRVQAQLESKMDKEKNVVGKDSPMQTSPREPKTDVKI